MQMQFYGDAFKCLRRFIIMYNEVEIRVKEMEAKRVCSFICRQFTVKREITFH